MIIIILIITNYYIHAWFNGERSSKGCPINHKSEIWYCETFNLMTEKRELACIQKIFLLISIILSLIIMQTVRTKVLQRKSDDWSCLKHFIRISLLTSPHLASWNKSSKIWHYLWILPHAFADICCQMTWKYFSHCDYVTQVNEEWTYLKNIPPLFQREKLLWLPVRYLTHQAPSGKHQISN